MEVLYTVKERPYMGNEMRIVKYEGKESKWKYGVESRPMLINPIPGEEEPWGIMGGSVGYNESLFTTYTELRAFVEKGLREEEENPEIWLEMLEC